MLARVRSYFAAERVLEVQTPLLATSAVSDPEIESIAVLPRTGRREFLQTSPEYPMKRLLAAGVGDCFQICPVFRDGESGRRHSPEFTMIEWYRLGFGVEELQRDVDRLLRAATAGLLAFAPSHSVTIARRSHPVAVSTSASRRSTTSPRRSRPGASIPQRPMTGIAMPGSIC